MFGLFDDQLSTNERRLMADKLMISPWPRLFDVGKPKFPTDKMLGTPKLENFIGERSWSVFHKLGAECEWLNLPVEEWDTHEEFKKIKSILSDFKVVISWFVISRL